MPATASRPRRKARTGRRYAPAVREDAVARVRRGEKVAEVAQDLGASDASIRYWLKADNGSSGRVMESRGAGDRPKVTFRAAIEKVLRQSRKPLHVEEITRRVIKMAGVTTEGKTPLATVAAILATENLRPAGEFVRVAPATYGLRHRDAPASPQRRRRKRRAATA